jgi:hypothetical protein
MNHYHSHPLRNEIIMSKVVNLHAERWIEGIFEESGLRVDVSTKGNVRFRGNATLTMEQMARLGEALSIAYRKDDDDNDDNDDDVNDDDDDDDRLDNVINMHDFCNPWKEVLTIDNECSMLQVYLNERTGEVEIVQMNDNCEVIRTQLSSTDALLLSSAISMKRQKALQ